MSIKDKIWELCKKYEDKCERYKRFDLVVLRASYSKHNPTVTPDETIGYANWSGSSEVLIVLCELLDFIKKSEKGVDNEK